MITTRSIDGLLQDITDVVPVLSQDLPGLSSLDANFLRRETTNAISIFMSEFLRGESPALRDELSSARDADTLISSGSDLEAALTKPDAEARIEEALAVVRKEITNGFADRHRAYRKKIEDSN